MKNEMISVLIPVYNVERYIERCLNCVINQTYKNIEILVVWQPSEDKTWDILKGYQEKDNRIRIIEQLIPDLATARNTLIKESKGEIICFVDSDDMISNHFIEILYKKMCDEAADIVTTQIFAFKNANQINKELLEKNKKSNAYNNIDFMKLAFVGKLDSFSGVIQAKLYKKELFDNAVFPQKRLSEDNATIYKIYWYAKKIITLNCALYYYQSERSDSIMHKKSNIEQLLEASYMNRLEQFEFFINKNEILLGISAYNILTARMRLIGNGSLTSNNDKIVEKVESKKFYYLKKVLINKNDLKIKLISIFCVLQPNIMYNIWLKRKHIKYKNEWRKK